MRSVFAVSFLSAFLAAGLAGAAQCPHNPDGLGTSRVLVIDPNEHMLLGSMQYRETLPLADREVVLTFDDGPLAPYTTRILEMLAAECVKATYFLVGRMMRSNPELVRRIYNEGHTVGTHSQNHPFTFHTMSVEKAAREIEDGFESARAALGDPNAVAPFFRIPGLLRANGVEEYLSSRGYMTWSADVPGDDWLRVSADEVAKRTIERLEAKGKGIVLLHDIQSKTVLALPRILKELKARRFRIVHVVPSTADRPKTVTEPEQWLIAGARPRAKKPWPQVAAPAVAEQPGLPAPGLQSFGIANPDGSKALVPPRSRSVITRAEVPLPPLPPWPRTTEPVEVAADVEPNLPAPSADAFALKPPIVAETTLHPGMLRASVDPETTGSVRPRPAATSPPQPRADATDAPRPRTAQKRRKPAHAGQSPGSLRTIFSQTPPKPPAPVRARTRTPDGKPVTTSSLRPD
jgi:peptidoglycan/xylan/chitin deacetylase (PgdA/CDA1 family)